VPRWWRKDIERGYRQVLDLSTTISRGGRRVVVREGVGTSGLNGKGHGATGKILVAGCLVGG